MRGEGSFTPTGFALDNNLQSCLIEGCGRYVR